MYSEVNKIKMGMWKRRIKGPMPRKMRSLYIRGKKGVVCLFVLEVKIFFDAMKNFFSRR